VTTRVTFEHLVAIVNGDRELIVVLLEQGIIEQRDDGFCAADVDRALATKTLVRDLDVNWPGVDIILRLREELAEARRVLGTRSSDDADAETEPQD